MAGAAASGCVVWRHLAPVCVDFQQFFWSVLFHSLVCAAAGSLLLHLGAFSARICSYDVDVFDPERLGRRDGGAYVVAGAMDETYGPLVLAASECNHRHFGDLLELVPATRGSVRGLDEDRYRLSDFGATSWTAPSLCRPPAPSSAVPTRACSCRSRLGAAWRAAQFLLEIVQQRGWVEGLLEPAVNPSWAP